MDTNIYLLLLFMSLIFVLCEIAWEWTIAILRRFWLPLFIFMVRWRSLAAVVFDLFSWLPLFIHSQQVLVVNLALRLVIIYQQRVFHFTLLFIWSVLCQFQILLIIVWATRLFRLLRCTLQVRVFFQAQLILYFIPSQWWRLSLFLLLLWWIIFNISTSV